MKQYSVTGTFHGSHIFANSEGEARRIFHAYYNGESILTVMCDGIECAKTRRTLADFIY